MRQRVYYYPPASKGGYSNPYSSNYKQALQAYFEVLDKENKPSWALGLSFFLYAFRADIYIINWLESVVFLRLGYCQYWLVRFGLWVIKRRKKKIVWMFHNIHPHTGENAYSKRIQKILFDTSYLIISHSQEAASYAHKNAKGEVCYICHPIKYMAVKAEENADLSDVLIWGSISPYKGVVEFLHELQKRHSELKVHIAGKCDNQTLYEAIKLLCGKKVLFENERISFDKLAGLIKHSKWVLFPYVGSCVSSSGALIDTIALGGNPIGPDKGAFKDLASEGLCTVYTNYNSLFSILYSTPSLGEEERKKFIAGNSWENFADLLYRKLSING